MGAHAAGVRAGVVVADPLVVLGGRQRQHPPAVAEPDEGDLLAEHEGFDQNARAGEPEGAGVPGHALQVAREELEVPGNVLLALPGEPRIAILDVGRIGDLGGLAIGDDVDPGLHLPAYRLRALLGHAGRECGRVAGIPPVAGEEEVDGPLASRQRADVGGGDAGHAGPPCCRTGRIVAARAGLPAIIEQHRIGVLLPCMKGGMTGGMTGRGQVRGVTLGVTTGETSAAPIPLRRAHGDRPAGRPDQVRERPAPGCAHHAGIRRRVKRVVAGAGDRGGLGQRPSKGAE